MEIQPQTIRRKGNDTKNSAIGHVLRGLLYIVCASANVNGEWQNCVNIVDDIPSNARPVCKAKRGGAKMTTIRLTTLPPHVLHPYKDGDPRHDVMHGVWRT